MDWNEWLATDIVTPYDTPAHRAYDFWIGSWRAEWLSRVEGGFDYTVCDDLTRNHVFPALGGKVLLELTDPYEIDPAVAQQRGFSLRYYIEEEDRWVMVQHWPSPGARGIAYTDQLTGHMTHGRVELFSVQGPPPAGGVESHRRYTFSDIRPDALRWDGAVTHDGGATWNTWNVVPMTRVAAFPDLVTPGPDWPTYGNGLLCADAPFQNLDALLGQWSGTVTTGGETTSAQMAAGRMLDGCAPGMVFVHPETGYRLLAFYSYAEIQQHWVQLRIDNQPGTRHSYRISPELRPSVFEDAPSLVIANRHERYLSRDRFNSSEGLGRTVIEEVSSARLVIREDVRDTPAGEWRVERCYDLSR